MKIKLILFSVFAIFSFALEAEPLTVDDFTARPDYYDADISPDGHYLAEVKELKKYRIVTITDLQAPGRPIVGKFGDKIIRAYGVIWANNDRLLVQLHVPYDASYVRNKSERDSDYDVDDNAMFSRTMATDIHFTSMVPLMQDRVKKTRYAKLADIKHLLPSDSQHILMLSDVGGRIALFKVNIYDGKSELVVVGGASTFAFISDKNGNPLYRLDYRRFSKTIVLYQYDQNQKWTKIDKIDIEEVSNDKTDLSDFVGELDDGSLLYRKKNEETGYYEILKRAPGSDKSVPFISFPDKSVVGLIYSNGDNSVIGYQIEAEVIENRYFDSDRQQRYDKIKEKIGAAAFWVVSSDDQRRLSVLETYGKDLPGGYFLFDSKNDKLEFLGNAYDKLIPRNLAIPAVVNYKARDGQKIHTYILLPPGFKSGKPYPLVVMPHGGPQARDFAYYDGFAQFVATRGYIVVQPNFRGSTGYGIKFEKAGYKQWGKLMQDDLEDAVHFFVKAGYADPDKVCLVGGSYGGYAAVMGLVKTPDLYRCAVSINGVMNLRDQIAFDEKRFRKVPSLIEDLHDELGDPKLDREYLDRSSPALHADKIKAPVLLISGIDDEVVPHRQSKDMAKALKKLHKEVQFVELKYTTHDAFYYREDQEKIYQDVEAFLAKYLGEVEADKKAAAATH